MSVSLWRIATDTPRWKADDLSGTGAMATGGRWNRKGIPVVYSSANRALACLETQVHLDAGSLPFNRYLVEIVVPDAVWAAAQVETTGSLPIGWDAEPAGLESLNFGTNWLIQGSSCLLIIPSAIVAEECNVLINPAHASAAQISATKIRRWLYDPRLL